MESGIRQQEIYSSLCKTPHRDLSEYIPIVTQAAKDQPEFLSHLQTWNLLNGQVRDSKEGIPVVALASSRYSEPEFVESSLACIASLNPRQLVRAFKFSRAIQNPVLPLKGPRRRMLNDVLRRYLRALEDNWAKWERFAVQYRVSLVDLYCQARFKHGEMADQILFKKDYPRGSVFEAIANLKNMGDAEAAAAIVSRRIPFLVAKGALGAKAKNPALVLALIERMSPSELRNHSKELEGLGIKTIPAIRAAYEAALARASRSSKDFLKTATAIEAVEDEEIKEKLRAVQERQIKASGVEGRWAILADASGSMQECIEDSRYVSSTLAKMCKDKVYLLFFNTAPRFFDVSGMDYDEVLKKTKSVTAAGGTSIGVGLEYLNAIGSLTEVDGICILSDCYENSAPWFVNSYREYCKKLDRNVPVYIYSYAPEKRFGMEYSDKDLRIQLKQAGIEYQEFKMDGKTDKFSIPNLAQSMKVNKYSLAQAILDTPLLTLDGVLGPKRVEVHA
jgi:hypothetical protein